MAVDVQRFLTGEPIEARPPSAWYRYRKSAGRNKLAPSTVALCVMVLVVGAAVGSWFAAQAVWAKRVAESAESRARLDRVIAVETRADKAALKALDKGKPEQEPVPPTSGLKDMFELGLDLQEKGRDQEALAVFENMLTVSDEIGRLPRGTGIAFIGAYEFKRREKYAEAARLLELTVRLCEVYREELETIRALMREQE